MDLNELEESLDEIRFESDHDEWGMTLVVSMVGKLSEGLMRVNKTEDNIDEAVEKSDVPEEKILEGLEVARRDLFGAMFVAVAELAHEEDVDINKAVEERLEHMKRVQKARSKAIKWQEAGLTDDVGRVDTDLDSENDWAFM